MNTDFFKHVLWFIVLVLAQVFVFNNIHLFGIATPFINLYFILQFSKSAPQWATMFFAFLMGIVIDTFANTPGVSSASLTLLAAIQPFVLSPFVPRDSIEDFKPSISSLGFLAYFWYVSILILIYAVCFFTLDMFSFFNIIQWLQYVGGSSLLTILLIYIIEQVRSRL
ncbi:MAG: rod shape-determining protein MreD [Prevotella sp.]|nr:rod shape-determining protein MreD [Prevotellaceae bacterium]MDY3935782.1 rod shape-determining protein MreD [Prevotella sp.]